MVNTTYDRALRARLTREWLRQTYGRFRTASGKMPKRINQHQLSVRIAELEGKKREVNIAQIKEILKITLELLANSYEESQVLALLKRHRRIND